jgi:hypothetical protein
MNLHPIFKIAGVGALALAAMASPVRMTAQAGDTVLKAADAQKLLPTSVFYHGQSAPTQARNSGGVKFADGSYVLAVLVDTAGYSDSVAAKYQGYFIAETPIKLDGKKLPAGAYGFGFTSDNKFVLTDIGGHDVLAVAFATDEAIKRPMPLLVQAEPGGGFRLYTGRKYVHFSR